MYQFVGAWGPIDYYPETRADLDEYLMIAAPCDGCENSTRSATGLACEAFRSFVHNATRWQVAPRQPTQAAYEELFGEPVTPAA